MLSGIYSSSSPTLQNNLQLRQPRAIVLINKIAVLWVDITINTTTFYIADSYRVQIPLNGQPPSFNLTYLSTLAQLTVEIWVGFPSNPNAFTTSDLTQIIVGDCDEMIIDPLSQSITLSGRDLTSRLIDTKTFKKYPNLTASNIAIELANEHGLTPVVTPTSGNVGTFYSNANSLMLKQTTEWDLLTFLAEQSGYVTYVIGTNLYFQPKLTVQNSTPFVLKYQAPNALSSSPVFNGMYFTITRQFTLSKDVTVKIRVPYSPLTGRAFTVSAGKTNPTINSTHAGNQIYTFTYAGLTQQQAQQKANTLLQNITLNELKLTARLPGDNTLTKASVIKVTGTGTRFDQTYFTNSIVRRISISEGYEMEVTAKNIDTNSEIIL